MKVSADLRVSGDDTVSGTYIVAVETGAGAAVGLTDEQAARQILDDAGLAANLTHSRERAYSGDGFTGTRVDFRDEPLASFAPTEERFGIVRDGDEFVVSGKATSTSADSSDVIKGADLTVSLTFPGPVSETNGTVEGTTVSWNLVGGPDELLARASAKAAFSPWPGVIAAVLVLSIAAIGLWRAPAAEVTSNLSPVRQGRHSPQAHAPAGDAPARRPVAPNRPAGSRR